MRGFGSVGEVQMSYTIEPDGLDMVRIVLDDADTGAQFVVRLAARDLEHYAWIQTALRGKP